MTSVLFVLGFLCAIGCFFAWHGRLRPAFLMASAIQTGVAFLIAEGLSLFGVLRQGPVCLTWLLWTVIWGAIFAFVVSRHPETLVRLRRRTELFRRREVAVQRLFWGLVGVLLTVSLAVALLSPPNNYDAMAYHLPRVMRWIQDGCIHHYPTHCLRQLAFPYGSSYLCTHIMLLGSADRFVNLIQWGAYLQCLVCLSLLGRLFGIGHRASGLVTALGASIPMAVLQASTPQNDLLCSAWLLTACVFLFDRAVSSRQRVFWLGLSFAIAVATKHTAMIFGIPLGGVFVYRILRTSSEGYRSVWQVMVVMVLSVSLSLPLYLRNQRTFGNPLGTSSGTIAADFGPRIFLSNVLRTVSLSIPSGPWWDGVVWAHRHLLRMPENLPATTIMDGGFRPAFVIPRLLGSDEDFIGAPLHLMLLLLILVLSRLNRYRNLDRTGSRIPDAFRQLAVAVLLGWGICLAVLKWQCWINRLLLPGMMLACVLLAVAVYRLKCLNPVRPIVWAALFYALFCCVSASRRPLFPIFGGEYLFSLTRHELLMAPYPVEERVYQDAADILRGRIDSVLGVCWGENHLEYPLWVILGEPFAGRTRIVHYGVTNPSAGCWSDDTPDVVLLSDARGYAFLRGPAHGQ